MSTKACLTTLRKRAASTVFGLRGSGGEDVDVELNILEAKSAEGVSTLLDYLKEKHWTPASRIEARPLPC
jgi:hypothetical protein